MAYNAANTNLEEVKKKEKFARDQEIFDLKDILATNAGIRFFKRFLTEGRIFNSTFTGNSQTFFLEGKRALALQIFEDICIAAPEKIAELMINKEKEDADND